MKHLMGVLERIESTLKEIEEAARDTAIINRQDELNSRDLNSQ